MFKNTYNYACKKNKKKTCKKKFKNMKKKTWGLGYGSLVECVPSIMRPLVGSPAQKERKKRRREERKEGEGKGKKKEACGRNCGIEKTFLNP
jgi:hypothetical protein